VGRGEAAVRAGPTEPPTPAVGPRGLGPAYEGAATAEPTAPAGCPSGESEGTERGSGTMRKLASIQTVNAAEPIPNADAIERLRVLGWWVVGKKGEFRPGDRVVYCEIDSLLPERPEF